MRSWKRRRGDRRGGKEKGRGRSWKRREGAGRGGGEGAGRGGVAGRPGGGWKRRGSSRNWRRSQEQEHESGGVRKENLKKEKRSLTITITLIKQTFIKI